jgi:hypothetical protein
MNLSRPLLVLGAVVLAVVVLLVFFFNRASQSSSVSFQQTSEVDPATRAKAEEHCWFSVKSRSDLAKADRVLRISSAGATTQRLGDLIIVTGALERAVGDTRFYGCALYEYTEGSPVVVASKASASPLRADALIPYGFTSAGKKQ